MKHTSRKKRTLPDAEPCFLPIFLLFGLQGQTPYALGRPYGAYGAPGIGGMAGQLYAPYAGRALGYGGAAPYGAWGVNPALRWIV